jgi:hypothetical protein
MATFIAAIVQRARARWVLRCGAYDNVVCCGNYFVYALDNKGFRGNVWEFVGDLADGWIL